MISSSEPGAKAIERTGPQIQNLATAAVLTLVLVMIADVAFYRQMRIGWTLGGFGALVAVAMASCNRQLVRSRIGIIHALLLAGLCAAAVEEPSPLGCALYVAGLLSFGLASHPEAYRHAGSWLAALTAYLIEAGCSLVEDTTRVLHATSKSVAAGKLSHIARAWLLPIAGGAVFLALFASANPVLASWLLSVDLTRIVPLLPDSARVGLWLSVGLSLWLVLRTRVRSLDPFAMVAEPAGPNADIVDMRVSVERLLPTEAIVRALIVFNVLFAIQNGMDIAYLWGHVALPPGFTYAGYAHRSAYPLIATALLAAAFVLVAFRPGSAAASSRALKFGMYLWIGQNVFLVVSAIWRTWLYVETYSLTHLRVAALIWMALVALGLVLLVIRFAADRDNRWLVNTNVLAALTVLYAVCFVDLGRVIADFNVAHCREMNGAGERLDLAYLQSIGPSALPALRRFEHHLKGSPATGQWLFTATPSDIIAGLESDLQARVSDWRSWTWRHSRLASASRQPDN
jgi:hypothetical protein